MADGKLDALSSDNLASIRTSGASGPSGNRNDLSAQEISTIGSLSRFSASPTAG